jgi:hypothetical protein
MERDGRQEAISQVSATPSSSLQRYAPASTRASPPQLARRETAAVMIASHPTSLGKLLPPPSQKLTHHQLALCSLYAIAITRLPA